MTAREIYKHFHANLMTGINVDATHFRIQLFILPCTFISFILWDQFSFLDVYFK